jgi:hypothetical protein
VAEHYRSRPDFFWMIANLTSGIVLPVNYLPDYALKADRAVDM